MSLKNSLSKTPTRGRSQTANKPIIPEELRLPDGRRVPVKDITKKITNRSNHNLRSKRTFNVPDSRPGIRTCPQKYTIEERIWQAQATVEDIAKRYGYTQKRAQGIKYNSRYIVDKLGLDPDSKE